MAAERDMTDLAALIEADVKASGARTPAEMADAFVASALSLMKIPEPAVQIVRREAGRVEVAVTLQAPRWLGGELVTSDMKRLCDAVKGAAIPGVSAPCFTLDGKQPVVAMPEAIVRAVLMELREPSQEMAKAGWRTFDYPPSPSPQEVWRAMIDHILAEP